jgi:hypothetical protein
MNNLFAHFPQKKIERINNKIVFPFNQNLFWDYPIKNIDLEKNKNFIIERVLSRGLLQDFYYLIQIYTAEIICNAVSNSKSLDKKTINFCSHYFKIPISNKNATSFYN